MINYFINTESEGSYLIADFIVNKVAHDDRERLKDMVPWSDAFKAYKKECNDSQSRTYASDVREH